MNIHILSDAPRSLSSYSQIVRNLSKELSRRGHNVTITGFVSDFDNYNGIPVLPLSTPFSSAKKQFADNLNLSKAEALICIHEAYKRQSNNTYSQMFYPTYFWVPVEGEGSPDFMIRDLKSPAIKEVISMSHAGKKELESTGVVCKVVYPGYDPEVFTDSPEPHCKYSMDTYQHTLDIRTLAHRKCYDCAEGKNNSERKYTCQYFENETITINVDGSDATCPISNLQEIKDKAGVESIIGCVAQNIGTRKKHERLIEAFSKMENNKECLLHLHTLPVSLMSIIDLYKVTKLFNVANRVMFSYGSNPVHGISDNGMNCLYNYFDIYATATSYEGFGMPNLESMAVGKAQIAPACGTGPELLGNNERGLLASLDKMVMEVDGLWRGLVNVQSLANNMDILFADKNLRNKLGSGGKEWAKQYTWDKIADRWEDILLKDENNKNNKDKNKEVIIA